jgi:tRNA nucleotidyltransferase (CCA-adding enzyme)
MIALPPEITPILKALSDHQITPIVVGGYVRDALLHIHSKDIDIELYNLPSLETLEQILKPYGKLNLVGKSFGVIKLRLNELEIDFSPPRTESKHTAGHRGFEVHYHLPLDFTTAARRRDFTINAIGYNPQTKTLLDPHNGIDDLRNKRLMCVNEQTFIEDPLRPLRAIQFAARFELSCDPLLLSLCKDMIAKGALEELPKERIFEEFKKLFLLASKPSIGMELLRQMGGLPFFSPLDHFEDTPQDPITHPEGNVWDHTLMTLDVMASLRTGNSKRDLTRMFAMLLHDCAKPITTAIINGAIRAPKHGKIGVEVGKTFLEKITNEHGLTNTILPLIRYHGKVRKLYENEATIPQILHLSTRVPIEELILVAQADFFGREFRGERPQHFDAGVWLYGHADKLGVLRSPPKPLIMGRDLIALGLKSSEKFKTILNTAYEAQLNQEFFAPQEAIQWLKTHLVMAL